MNITEALAADAGLVCVTGAGGKKTTLYSLANRQPRAVVTATVRIPIFDSHVSTVEVTDDPVGALDGRTKWPVGLVPEREREDRYRGYDPETVSTLREHADVVLVKADGARTRWLKAPNEREPRLPATADTVIPIASARVVGQPLDADRVHRPERVAAITGRELGETITASDVASVLVSPRGGLKGVPADATVVPLINMVDDDELEAVGREIATAVLSRADADVSRVVLARMNAPDPLVDVVEDSG